MATNFSSILSTGITTTPGTSLVLPVDVPDNCHTVLITNVDSANTIYVQQAAAGGALAASSSLIVPTSGSASIVIGPHSQRPGDINAAGKQLVFDSNPAATVAHVTYICGITT